MNINRNNYEEYFLLYADNELSAEDRSLIELFVQQNIDLEEEFLMIQQSVIKPEKYIGLSNKDFLFREKKEFINYDNYIEKFILYNDDELNEEKRLAIENFIKENPSVYNEFNLLQRVKLQPEASMSFPDKKLLYKKEGKLIPFAWWKVAAVAVLLGTGIWTGINYIQKDKTGIPVAIKTSKKISLPAQPLVPISKPEKIINKEEDNNKNTLVINQKNEINPVASLIKKKSTVNKSQIEKSNNGVNKSFDNNSTKTPLEQVNPEQGIAAIQFPKESADIPNKSTNDLKPVTDNLDIDNNIDDDLHPSIPAQTVSYATEPEDENYIFYNVSTEKFNKSKLGGFLKKVKRVIQRKSPFSHKASDNKNEVAYN